MHGIIRRASTFNTRRLDHIYWDPHNGDQVRLYLHYGDIGSSGNLTEFVAWSDGSSTHEFCGL